MKDSMRAHAAILAAVVLIAVGIILAIASQPAQARDVEPEWTWKVYPTDKTNVMALWGISVSELGERVAEIIAEYEAEQAALEEQQYYEPYYYEPAYYAPSYSGYSNDFKSAGVVYDGGTRYTWYSQRVLPGGGLDELNANGRTVNSEGFVVDGDGYIAVASCDHAQGEVIETPFGEAKVYDVCGASGTVDVYTDF